MNMFLLSYLMLLEVSFTLLSSSSFRLLISHSHALTNSSPSLLFSAARCFTLGAHLERSALPIIFIISQPPRRLLGALSEPFRSTERLMRRLQRQRRHEGRAVALQIT